jgi:hypothetical protein
MACVASWSCSCFVDDAALSLLLRFVSVAFFALFLLVFTSGDFWFAFNEAPRTALRCNRSLKMFNVYYSADECKLYRITSGAGAGSASNLSPSSRSDSSTGGTFQFRARVPVVRSDNMRTFVVDE